MRYTVHIEQSSKVNVDGRANVMLRISNGRKGKKRINTGIKVKPSEFNGRAKFNHWIRSNNSMHGRLNNELKKWLLKAEAAASELESKKVEITLENVTNYLKGNNMEQSINFIDFYYQELELMKQGNRVNSYHRHVTSIRKLEGYLSEKNMKLYFEDLDLKFLHQYRNYLISKKLAQNTVYKELENIRTILNKSVKMDLVKYEQNPFLRFTMKKQKVFKEKLTIEEITRIEKLNLNADKQLDLVRDLFVAQFYLLGIRFGDITRLKWSDIRDGRIMYTMNKTSVTKSIKILDRVKLIFEKYRKSPTQRHIFPVLPEHSDKLDEFEIYRIISNQNAIINRDLKKIAKMIGTSTKISTHIARHSFADYLRSKNVDIYSISDFLGHSNVKITQNYLSSMKDSESDAILSEVFK